MGNLVSLWIGDKLGDEGVKAMQHQKLNRLTQLSLYRNGMGDEGAIAIPQSKNLEKTGRVKLNWNFVEEEGIDP
ncbi:MAG: hypothetical protein CM1200mP16_03370 [Nitrospina sp.]|nr:MAG: hypothetical protein CM1200mP16_03370 [Nitrospina sp.]